jgi:hypothetical protein
MLVFVDETGSNTCQVTDGHADEQLFILPKDGSSGGALGSAIDVHFTVLQFVSGTGDAIMWSIILKSEKLVKEIPMRWRNDIEISKDLLNEESDQDLFMVSTGNGKAMAGRPTCIF